MISSKKSLFQVYFKVYGIVQGVGFRWFVADETRSLNINGWVRNCYDGTVEGVLQGGKDAIEQAVNKIKLGPSMSRVDDVEVRWEIVKNIFNSFEIRH